MMVALPRGANAGARLTLATLLALGAASLVACDDGRTYYPIKHCETTRCEVFGANGKQQRVLDALPPERFVAVPAQQDVMSTGVGFTYSLVKDFSFECRVADQRNWHCMGPSEPDFIPEGYFMADGELSHAERRLAGEHNNDYIQYTTWCSWEQVDWHNSTSDKDDPPTLNRSVLRGLLPLPIYELTAAGCKRLEPRGAAPVRGASARPRPAPPARQSARRFN